MARRSATLIIPAGLDRHPVVIKLSRLMHIDVDCVIGKVVKIIEWCAQHSTDGIVIGAQLEDFEAVARCELGNAFGTLLERISVPMRASSGTHEQVQLCAFLECFGKAAKNKAFSARRKKRHAVCIARTRTHAQAGLKDKRQIQAGRRTDRSQDPVSDPAPVAIAETQREPQRGTQRPGRPVPQPAPATAATSQDRPERILNQKGQPPAAKAPEPDPEPRHTITVELEDAPPGVPSHRVAHWIEILVKAALMPRPLAEELLRLPEVDEARLRWGLQRLTKRLADAKLGKKEPLKKPYDYLEPLLREGPGEPGTFGRVGGGERAPRSFDDKKNSLLEQARALKHAKAVAAAGGV